MTEFMTKPVKEGGEILLIDRESDKILSEPASPTQNCRAARPASASAKGLRQHGQKTGTSAHRRSSGR